MRAALLILLALVGASKAGVCPKYPIIKDFDFTRYMGLWFQQDKLQASWEAPGRCWKTLYSRDRKNGQFKMKMIFSSTITGRVEEYDSQLTLKGPTKPSIIEYTIPLTFMDDEFQVLATDYESFSVEYKCDPNGLLEKRESIFLLTREKSPSPLVLQRAYAIMHRLGVDIRKLERVDQTCGGIEITAPTAEVFYDYDYNASPQAIEGNRRKQSGNYYYDDYDYAQEYGTQQADPSNYYALSYPPQPSDSNQQRTRARPPVRRRQPSIKRQTVPNDERITLGQSLATRLWHVLHKPVRK
ncbi:apolipoprotein D-like [Penaeus vannamei]|uniref:apolipoprotein D-like n=1 Tax=Penaeus vannamei TaxID=6689 RepID=UPI00387F7D1F